MQSESLFPWPFRTFPTTEFFLQPLPEVRSAWPVDTYWLPLQPNSLTKPDRTPFSASLIPWPQCSSSMQKFQQPRCWISSIQLGLDKNLVNVFENYHKQTNMTNINLGNKKTNLTIFLLYYVNINIYITKTVEILKICSRRDFYINKGIFFSFSPHCKAIISQRHWSVVMLILDQHYYENAGTTLTWGYRTHRHMCSIPNILYPTSTLV